jgi:hypothetical protein
LLILLYGCAKNPDLADKRMKDNFILRQMIANGRIYKELLKPHSTDPEMQAAIMSGKLIFSLRNNYSAQPDRNKLLIYCDSILNKYKAIPAQPRVTDEHINAIKHFRASVINGTDSTSMVNLYYYLLVAEGQLLEYYLNQERGMIISNHLPVNICDSTFAPGDTVRLAVNSFFHGPKNSLAFDNVICSSQGTGPLIPKVTRFEQFYLLEYYPKQRGKYTIEGTTTIMFVDQPIQLFVNTEFTVR